MCHEGRHGHALQNGAGGTAEHKFAEPGTPEGTHDQKIGARVGDAIVQHLTMGEATRLLHLDRDIDIVTGECRGDGGACHGGIAAGRVLRVDAEHFDAACFLHEGQGIEGGTRCLTAAVPGEYDLFELGLACLVDVGHEQDRATALEKQGFDIGFHGAGSVRIGLLGDDEIGRHSVKGRHQPAYPFALRPSEVACFLSHRKVWRMIVERGLDAGLIVEDDVALDMPLFGRCMEVAKQACVGKAYVQFRISPVRGRVREMARDGDIRLLAPQVSQLGTVAQLVTREAAQHLLALTERFDRPVDTFLQMRWVTGIAPFCVVPSGIGDQSAEIGGSTVSASG